MKISTLFSTGTTKKVLERTSDSWLQREIEVIASATEDVTIDGKVAYIENVTDNAPVTVSLGEYNNELYRSVIPPGGGLVVPTDNSVKSLGLTSKIDSLQISNLTTATVKVKVTTV